MDWNELFSLRKKIEKSVLKKHLNEMGFVKNFKIIHVVGTNGKGSVSNYIYQGLRKNGFKVGLFTSPHIHRANERIIVNDNMITDQRFFDLYNKYEYFLKKDANFFSIIYLIAMKYFQEENVDFVIMEAGIGGKEDTTSICHGEYALLTSVGLDHIKLLGNSQEEILLDKIGITTREQTLYLPSFLGTDLLKIAQENSKARLTKILNNDGTNFMERNQKLAFEFLDDIFGILMKDFKPLFGRCSIIQRANKSISILDVAHNENGIIETLNYLKRKQIDYSNVIISINKSKVSSNLKKILKDKNVSWYVINDNFQNFSEKWPGKEIKNIKSAYKNQQENTLYIGSFLLVGELWNEIKE